MFLFLLSQYLSSFETSLLPMFPFTKILPTQLSWGSNFCTIPSVDPAFSLFHAVAVAQNSSLSHLAEFYSIHFQASLLSQLIYDSSLVRQN